MALLVAGCGLGGVAVGAVLDRFGAPFALARTTKSSTAATSPAAASTTTGSTTTGPTSTGPTTTGPTTTGPTSTGPTSSAPATPAPGGRPSAGPAPLARSVAASLVTGAVCALAAHHFGAVPVLAAYAVLFAGLVSLSVIDLRVTLVPRVILYPLGALVLLALIAASAADGQWRPLGDAAIGGVLALAVFFAIWWVYPAGMGMGDVRLSAVIGLGLGWLGLFHVYVGFVVGLVAGTVFGILLMLWRGTGRKTRLPLVPSLSIGAVVGVVWGGQIINAWFPGHH